MTRRAYWDRAGWLWEEIPGQPDRLKLLWDSLSLMMITPVLFTVPRAAVERGAGPLVGAA